MGLRALTVPKGYSSLVELSPDEPNLCERTIEYLLNGDWGTSSAADPAVVITVVGERESQKTSLLNSLIQSLSAFDVEKSKPFELFPTQSQAPAQNLTNGSSAVLISVPPFVFADDDGRRVVVALLDIWSVDPSPDVYAKMVSFCTSSASLKIFTCPNNSPGMSHLETNQFSFLKSPNEEQFGKGGTIRTGQAVESQPIPVMPPPTFSLKPGFNVSLDTRNILAFTGGNGSISQPFVPFVRVNTGDSRDLWLDVILNSLSSLAAENQRFDQLCEHFQSVFQSTFGKRSGGRISTESAAPKSVSHFCDNPTQAEVRNSRPKLIDTTEFSQLTTGHEAGNFETNERITPSSSDETNLDSDIEVDTSDEDPVRISVETKEFIQQLHIIKATESFTTPSSLQQVYLEQMKNRYKNTGKLALSQEELKEHHQTVISELQSRSSGDTVNPHELLRPYYAKLQTFHLNFISWIKHADDEATNISNRAQHDLIDKFKHDPFDRTTNFTQYYLEAGRSALNMNQTWTVEENSIYFFYDPSNFPNIRLKHLQQIYQSKIQILEEEISRILQGVYQYEKTVANALRHHICLKEAGLRSLDATASATFENMLKILELSNKYELARVLLDPVRAKIWNNNELVLSQESRIAKDAVRIAMATLQQKLEPLVDTTTVLFPQSELRHKLDDIVEHIMRAFNNLPSFKYTWPWMEEGKKLREKLSEIRTECLQKNLIEFQRLNSVREAVLNHCGQFYLQQMEANLPRYKVPQAQLDSIHQKSLEMTLSQFEKEDVPTCLQYYWREAVQTRLSKLKIQFADENQLKSPQINSANFPPNSTTHSRQQSTTVTQQIFEKSAANEPPGRVGIHFGPDVIRFALYKPSHTLAHVPYISFRNNGIQIGEEAKCTRSPFKAFNVYEILTNPPAPASYNNAVTVRFYGGTLTLRREEIAILFFKEAKRELQSQTSVQDIQTCTVAVPSLLPPGARQGLKSSLSIAGFREVTLMSYSTALALAVLLPPGEMRSKEGMLLCCYQTEKLVEVSTVQYSFPEYVHVHKTRGRLTTVAGVDEKAMRKVTDVVTEELGKCRGNVQGIILLWGDEYSQLVRNSVAVRLRRMTGGKIRKMYRTADDILAAAAKFENYRHHSSSRGPTSLPRLTYAHPYSFHVFGHRRIYFPSADADFTVEIIRLPASGKYFSIREDKGAYNTSVCTYTFTVQSSASHGGGGACKMLLHQDGTFNIEPIAGDESAAIVSGMCQFFTPWDRNKLKIKIQQIVENERQTTNETRGSDVVSGYDAAETHHHLPNQVDFSVNAAKSKLSEVMERVKFKLEARGMRDGPQFEFIMDRIRACQGVVDKRDVKLKAVEMALERLQLITKEL